MSDFTGTFRVSLNYFFIKYIFLLGRQQTFYWVVTKTDHDPRLNIPGLIFNIFGS
jgi:hypothetical protein